ncbi:MAG: hypothetical protein FJ253_12475, partial [Phycisphaerae bacterium]|nr:hypothetical protein [Phycisphaerae bacterium]
MKDISFVEQHVEKIVIGVAGAILVGAIAVEFMSSRSVTVGGQEISPSSVSQVLADRARAVESKLNDGLIHGGEFGAESVPAVSKEFAANLTAKVTDGAPLPRIAPTLAATLLDSDTLADTWYRAP